MKKIIFMAALLLLGVGVAQAQTSKQAKKEAKMEARAQAKAQREAERDARDAMIKTEEMQAFLTAKKSINQMDFVLEGSQIQLRSGANFFVNTNTNFIMVQGNQATIQVASLQGAGANGLGGITVEGTVSNLKYSVSNNGNVNLSMMVQGTKISASINLTLTHGTNSAYATIQPNFNSQRLTMTGILVPYSQSKIFMGTTSL
mgnify:CR=1 FL=1